MHHPTAGSELLQSHIDVAMVSIDRLSALASLLTVEDVASSFARLSPLEQVAIFGAFEDDLDKARVALLRVAESSREAHTPLQPAAPESEPTNRQPGLPSSPYSKNLAAEN